MVRESPMRPLAYMAADVCTNRLMTFGGMLLLLLAGWMACIG
jgi:hypothetical protein